MRKYSVILILTFTIFSYGKFARAGCTGLCLSLDSLSYGGNLVDTAYLSSGGNVKLFARYNNACRMIMEGQNPTMQLVWYKDGSPYDTTDLSNATYDNIWTYYTQYYITEPGLYDIYFLGFYQPNYPCKQILVLKENNTVTNNSTSSIDESKENGNNVLVYPNPSYDGMLYIHTKNSSSQVELFDLNGVKVLDMVLEQNNLISLNTISYRKGLYLIRISNEESVTTRKVMIN
jgi:hypothetical protein